ncbi:MAG: 6,7-dimethyl-8-ribityllumazine synthase [Rhodospirillaceae bacterium]
MTADAKTILVVEARFYEDIADSLYAGVEKVLSEAGYEAVRVDVPGVFEIPAAINFTWNSAKYAGCITLGCVIRGETDHYDHICREVSRSLMDMSLDNMAHGFGILTCEDRSQAEARADVNGRDVGGRAALACLRMIEIQNRYKG